MMQDVAQKFARERLKPGARAREEAGTIEKDVLEELGALGFLGMSVPTDLGGVGADYVAYALVLMELAAGDGAVSTLVSVHNAPYCAVLKTFGNKHQKETWLAPAAQGAHIGSFALTETQAGSDASALRTQAVRTGDHYKIHGQKQFITSAQISGSTLVFAVTDPDASSKGISCFIVPNDTPGFTVLPCESKLGQRASDTSALDLDQVEVSRDCLIGELGQGYAIALSSLETGRIGIAAQSVGMAQAAFDYALNYAQERETFGQPIVEHQAVRFRLADMATELEVGKQMVLHAARLKDAGEPCLKEACMAKLFASEMAEKVCSSAIQTLGGYGYLTDHIVEKIYRDVRVCQIYEGTSDIQKIIIAKQLLH